MTWFDGFEQRHFHVNGVAIHARIGGPADAPPLLMLHGFPQTQAIWHRVVRALAGRFRFVLPDLRGYGDSAKPAGEADHANYSKRAMAQDMAFASACYPWFHLIQPAPLPERMIGGDPRFCLHWALGRWGSNGLACIEPEAAGDKIGCDMLVLWGERGVVHRLFEPLALWQAQCAARVSGEVIAAGHFIPEELPAQTAGHLQRFFG